MTFVTRLLIVFVVLPLSLKAAYAAQYEHHQSQVTELLTSTVSSLDIQQPQLQLSHVSFSTEAVGSGFRFGHGPFAAIHNGQFNSFDVVAVGWMVNFNQQPGTAKGWHVGLGVMVETDFKAASLGNGSVFSSELITRSSRPGLALMAGFSF